MNPGSASFRPSRLQLGCLIIVFAFATSGASPSPLRRWPGRWPGPVLLPWCVPRQGLSRVPAVDRGPLLLEGVEEPAGPQAWAPGGELALHHAPVITLQAALACLAAPMALQWWVGFERLSRAGLQCCPGRLTGRRPPRTSGTHPGPAAARGRRPRSRRPSLLPPAIIPAHTHSL